jgi:hypothetical protein
MMKNLLICICLLGTGLLSCSKNEDDALKTDFDPQQFPQKWQLVKMRGSMVNSETTGAAMGWQESYLFWEDHKFTKSRQRGTMLTEASGTFVVEERAGEKVMILTYDSDSDLIGNCTSELKEGLVMTSNTQLLNGWWQACDGPYLEYARVEVTTD